MTNRIDVLDGYQADIEFENIVEWARLGAIHVRKVDGCDVQHRTFLLAHGESPERLNELSRWHESTAFTQRERVALGLSESISLYPSGNLSEHVLREARRHFSARQVVDLTLAILCVNDWIDLGPSSPLRVLVVEDNTSDQELLQRQLRNTELEARVKFVADAEQALHLLSGPEGKLLREGLIAMLLDLHLPGMSGIELLQRIRGIQGMEHFPVIVMTSSNDPLDIAECKRLKVASYVQKPVTVQSFSHAVANFFHNGRHES